MNISTIKRKITPILRENKIKRAAIFGSLARNANDAKSDVDMLIEFKGNDKSLFDLTGLQLQLQEKLQKKVDLVTYDSLSPLIRESILSEQKIIYKDFT
ncbi:MAG: nucleotidyltransferase domain-containing protein [Candidatus Pacebacteria bacterium]|nr:nucleotidyltransferase domain-containing protein [Candidatus Paceibacterota bacterium]